MSQLDTARLTRARQVFERALDSGSRDSGQLLEWCEGDLDLLGHVEALLEADRDDRPGADLDRSVSDWLGAVAKDCLEAGGAPLRSGDEIGNYRLGGLLATGTYGEVFAAEQLAPVRRPVAIKVLKAGLESTPWGQRFARECQVMATLAHPNIARALDAGATADGRPYLVLEQVRGRPIVEYADEYRLDLDQRLRLVVDICDGVVHAHQLGILHRDLKPANVLVERVGERHVAKLIDFGIAKVDGDALTGEARATGRWELLGTPEYMSSEQAGGGTDLDERADVFGLAGLAYELVTGCPPRPSDSLRGLPVARVRATIAEGEVRGARQRFAGLDRATRERVAGVRGRSAPHLERSLGGDLDRILRKGLAVDRDERYANAADLAVDLRRWLEGFPVQARPPGLLYGLWKLARRHRVASATALLALIGLSATTIVTAVALERTVAAERASARAAETARGEASRRQVVAQFLGTLLAGVRPRVALERDVTLLRELADESAVALTALDDDPLAELELREVLARTYLDLAALDRAAELLEPIDALVHRHRLDESEGVDGTLLAAEVAGARSDWDAVGALLDRAGDALDSVAPEARDAAWYLRSGRRQHALASLAVRRDLGAGPGRWLHGALECFEHSPEVRRQSIEERAVVLTDLARLCLERGELRSAEAEIAAARALLAGHPREVSRGMDLDRLEGRLLAHRGDPRNGLALVEGVTAFYAGVLGHDHPMLAECLLEEAALHLAADATADSARLAREAVDRVAGAHGEDHPVVVRGALLEARAHQRGGRLDAARRALALVDRAVWSAPDAPLDLRAAAELLDLQLDSVASRVPVDRRRLQHVIDDAVAAQGPLSPLAFEARGVFTAMDPLSRDGDCCWKRAIEDQRRRAADQWQSDHIVAWALPSRWTP